MKRKEHKQKGRGQRCKQSDHQQLCILCGRYSQSTEMRASSVHEVACRALLAAVRGAGMGPYQG